MSEETCTIKSARLLEELRTFIWNGGKGEAQSGYNDDLVMSWSIGMFLRDTSIRFMDAGIDSARASLNAMGSRNSGPGPVVMGRGDYGQQNPWTMPDHHGNQTDISWLI